MDGFGGPPYIGSGCFHRRDILGGSEFGRENNEIKRRESSIHDLEEKVKPLASCTYDENTQWGKEVSLFLFVFILQPVNKWEFNSLATKNAIAKKSILARKTRPQRPFFVGDL